MEDALAPVPQLMSCKRMLSLNPCCNGRCTRTDANIRFGNPDDVVLILVVMEDALAHLVAYRAVAWYGGLNPCCNGRCTRTTKIVVIMVKRKEVS